MLTVHDAERALVAVGESATDCVIRHVEGDRLPGVPVRA